MPNPPGYLCSVSCIACPFPPCLDVSNMESPFAQPTTIKFNKALKNYMKTRTGSNWGQNTPPPPPPQRDQLSGSPRNHVTLGPPLLLTDLMSGSHRNHATLVPPQQQPIGTNTPNPSPIYTHIKTYIENTPT